MTRHEELQPCVIQFVNNWRESVTCYWVNGDSEVEYHRLQPGNAAPQRTYTTHPWRVRSLTEGRLLGEYCGPSAKVVIEANGAMASGPAEGEWGPKPEWGQYRSRASVMGVSVMAYDCVCPAAVDAACHIVMCMLQHSPREVTERLAKAQCQVAIIGRCQVTTDIPEHSFMKLAKGGRDIDATTRGLGGTAEVPVTSCGEENLTMVDDSRYPMENILIHEFGHTVMNVGISSTERQRICESYDRAQRSGMYKQGIYMMDNADEYWAEGCQSWFDATIRTDVNDGHNTRDKLRRHDPTLAQLLCQTFGDGQWRYAHDCPAPLSHRAYSSAVPVVSTRPEPPDLQPPGALEMDRARLASTANASGGSWLTMMLNPVLLAAMSCAGSLGLEAPCGSSCFPGVGRHQPGLVKNL